MEERDRIFLGFRHLHRLAAIKRRVFCERAKLRVEAASVKGGPVPFSGRLGLRYRKAGKNSRLGGYNEGSWLHVTGAIPKDIGGGELVVWLNVFSEGTVFDGDGEAVASLGTVANFAPMDFFHAHMARQFFDMPEKCLQSGEVDLWVETANNGILGRSYGQSRLRKYSICIVNAEARRYYYDYLTLYFARQSRDDKNAGKELDALLARSYKASKASFSQASEILARKLGERSGSQTEIVAVGHSHLDVVWLWTLEETKRKAVRTFIAQLNNIDKYEGYIFGASQPVEYEWIKNGDPALYGKIKEAVRRGRIEPLGCMWLEPDMNMPSGESIVRQIQYGKKFFLEEFGIDPDVCWLPDVFGFGGNLPQILKKCGVDKFLTIKLAWNEVNEFPYTTFLWRGIDGSEVLAHMPPEGEYGSDAAYYAIRRAVRKCKDNPSVGAFLMPFGSSDGGGGAGEGHFESLAREKDLFGIPKVRQGSVKEFFEKIEAKKDLLPVYVGELYLETHQATYTTQSGNKLHNRKAEAAMHGLEALSVAAFEKGGEAFDKAEGERLWKSLLLEQFHDILPGSSIAGVYGESLERYKVLEQRIQAHMLELTGKLRSSARGKSAINLSPCPFRGYVRSGGQDFFVELGPYSAKPVEVRAAGAGMLRFDGDAISNGILAARFGRHGEIVSLVTENDGKEYCGQYLNRLTVYKDRRRFWNACNLDANYYKKRIHTLRRRKVNTYIEGASVVREERLAWHRTAVKLKTILTLESPCIEFAIEVDWKETHKMLRADFVPSEYGGMAKCDIQFGNICRSTKEDNPIEKAQFEICAHKYLDVSNEKYGSAVITDSKYGYRAKNGVISLNLLRSPMFPAKDADKGRHGIRYRFYPHPAGGDVTKEAYAFNDPPLVVDGEVEFQPLACVSNPGIVAETVKLGENGGVVLRLYENEGKRSEARVETAVKHTKSYLCDMLENVLEEVDTERLSFAPFEIKTILLK